jgi:hypothetical protein
MTKIEQKAKLSSLSYKLAYPLLLCLVSPFSWAQQVAVADTASMEETAASKEEPVADSSSEDAAAELAKKLSNPVANLISVPIQYTWTTGIGPAESDQNRIIVQPVTPVSINNDWNLIIRTIMPLYIDQQSPTIGGQDVSGTGDILQSFFFSPKALTKNGWVWAVGPVFNYATASNNAIGSGKWSAGPTALALKQANGTSYGLLANQLWSFAGSDNQADVSAMFLQPFLSHTTKKYTTYGINTQSTYNWETDEWSVPVFLTVSQLVKIKNKPVSFTLGYFNYVTAPEFGPDWGMQFTVTLLYPK